jgi:hypothetical protein
MSNDDLVCAACSGRVADGRCPICRAARSRLGNGAGLPPEAFLVVSAVAFVLLLALFVLA